MIFTIAVVVVLIFAYFLAPRGIDDPAMWLQYLALLVCAGLIVLAFPSALYYGLKEPVWTESKTETYTIAEGSTITQDDDKLTFVADEDGELRTVEIPVTEVEIPQLSRENGDHLVNRTLTHKEMHWDTGRAVFPWGDTSEKMYVVSVK